MAAFARRFAASLAAVAAGAWIAGCSSLPTPLPSALPAHDGAAGSDPRPTATLAVARYLYIRALDGAAVPFQLLPLRDCRWETPAGTADQPRR